MNFYFKVAKFLCPMYVLQNVLLNLVGHASIAALHGEICGARNRTPTKK